MNPAFLSVVFSCLALIVLTMHILARRREDARLAHFDAVRRRCDLKASPYRSAAFMPSPDGLDFLRKTEVFELDHGDIRIDIIRGAELRFISKTNPSGHLSFYVPLAHVEALRKYVDANGKLWSQFRVTVEPLDEEA